MTTFVSKITIIFPNVETHSPVAMGRPFKSSIFSSKVIIVSFILQNFAHPRHDEWNKFLYTTQELRNNQVDEDLEKLNLSVSNTPLSSMNTISTTPLR